MDSLFDGVRQFNLRDFEAHRDLFRELGRAQHPHTLFIGCSDSRVVPSLITKTLPGELFVVRNIANVVPMDRDVNEFLATTSAIEYAVKVLRVENIVVCGHSNCGGCRSIYLSDGDLADIPHTAKWLDLVRPVIPAVDAQMGGEHDPGKREWITEQLNVVEQMRHVLSFPYIRELYRQKKIRVMGWYYILETGEVFNYDIEQKSFSLIR